MNLSKRLQAVADMVPVCEKAADIGTDHGFIPVYLISNNKAKSVVAADVSKGSLEKARRLVRQKSLTEYIDLRLGKGLNVLSKGEVDTIIIAGMGGLLISSILEEDIDVALSAKCLIFQPMTAQGELREWLAGNGFKIIDENLVREDGRFYEIIKAVPGIEVVTDEIYYDIGYKLAEKRHPLLGEYLLKKIKELDGILQKLELSTAQSAKDRKEDIEDKLKSYKEIYKCIIR